jgi:thiamine kinase-like enzyme
MLDFIRSLSYWKGPVDIVPVTGGITNANFKVRCRGEEYFVRTGRDVPEHGILRFNERQASIAAAAAGISPAVLHCEEGAIIFAFIASRTLAVADIIKDRARIVALLRKVHRDLPLHLRGPSLIFWVFHVIRDYLHTLEKIGSSYRARFGEFRRMAESWEQAVGPVEIVYGHNDLLASNFLDDGARLWLVDWDYAGFNTPLFDLANLASNNGIEDGGALLESYAASPPNAHSLRGFEAMRCASLLRETLWSMVSEQYSQIDFDYAAYTADYLTRLELAARNFEERA